MVIPDEENISRFIRLYDMDGERQKLTDEDVFVTTNLSVVMDFEEEDFVLMQNMNLVQADVEVTKIVMNYLGNSIYMTETMYAADGVGLAVFNRLVRAAAFNIIEV